MYVLVTYVSPHGSTRGIAERIAVRLRDRGLLVDCLPIHETQAIGRYDGFVVGSAIHGRAWLPEASHFISTHAEDLGVKPVWLFSVGMPGALARPLRAFAMREGPKAVAPIAAMVPPRDSRLFSGVVDKQQFPLGSRAVLRLMGGHYGDFRDWPAIDGWANGIGDDLLERSRASSPGNASESRAGGSG